MKRVLLILAVMLAVACIIISCGEKNPTKQHTHDYGTEWVYNATHHWNECDCGEKSNMAEHIFDEGICTVCLYDDNHDCEGDEVWHYDDDEHWHECTICGEKKDIDNHDDDPCTICGWTHTHDFSEEWHYDDDEHWHECTICGERDDVANHDDIPCSICGFNYLIGGIGQAGGIIFYDKGDLTDGWRYLEAAPEDIGDYVWGAFGYSVNGTSTAIGTGLENTNIIVARLAGLGQTNRAAQVCVAYELNDYNDWFLPSNDELNLMYQNLHIQGLGGFTDNYYWSSSAIEGVNDASQIQGFSDGNMYSNWRSSSSLVRCVRRF
jgi:hypothetical protein